MPVGECKDSGAHVQASAASQGISHIHDPGVWEEESPRLACWLGVLVDWAWGTLNGRGTWVCKGVSFQPSTCARCLGCLWVGRALHQHTTPLEDWAPEGLAEELVLPGRGTVD